MCEVLEFHIKFSKNDMSDEKKEREREQQRRQTAQSGIYIFFIFSVQISSVWESPRIRIFYFIVCPSKNCREKTAHMSDLVRCGDAIR